MSYEIAFNLFLIGIGVFILIRSGVYVVRSLTSIARFLKVSEFTLSFIFMAFATTLPELAVGISSALRGESLISLGNILGANILNLSLVLGLVVLISGELLITHESKEKVLSHHWLTLFLGAAPLVFLIDLKLSRLEGAFLIALFLIYLARTFRLKAIFEEGKSFWAYHFLYHKEDSFPSTIVRVYKDFKNFLKNLVVFVIAAGLLLFSAWIIVGAAESISFKTGVSEFLVGLFIVALGTTLPELSFGLRAALSGRGNLSLGNLFGATAFNSTWILGIVALIHPIEITRPFPFWWSAGFVFLVLFLANLFLSIRKSLNRTEGLLLVIIYVIFAAGQIFY